MRYLGNKSRLAKELVPILTEHLDGSNFYIEPFVGAAGMISEIPYDIRLGFDSCPYIIMLLRAVQNGWVPPTDVNEEEYEKVKNGPVYDFPPEYVGFVGYGCSFGGKWFAGYARGGTNKDGQPRNHAAESSRNLLKLAPKIASVFFAGRKYQTLSPTTCRGHVLYCDPPYATGTQYKDTFDTEAFWNWVRAMSANNKVYVSENTAPDDFKVVWEKEHKSGIDVNAKTHKKTIERLFVYEDI